MALGRELRCIKLHEKFPHTAFAGHSKSHISNHAGAALEKEAPPPIIAELEAGRCTRRQERSKEGGRIESDLWLL